ncbi:serine hydrolase domain-containing protein [Mucilaginibacter corticis]|nr:serine hydrolase [Mucilaginibacter corticis]
MSTAVSAQSTSQNLDKYYRALAADHEMNGNVLFAQDNHILYQKSFGFSDAASGKLNNPDSQFELASVSKLFTATAVLQLRDKGLVDLDQTFQHYFPTFPYPGITLRHLLSHTSGLPDIEALVNPIFAKHPDTVWSIHDDLAALIPFSKDHALGFKPGDKWSYSSLGYHLLALLVEKVSGQTLADYTRDHIFKPAGMEHSYIQTSFLQKNEAHRTRNYMYNNHYEMKLQWVDTLGDWKEWTHNLGLITGGGGIISATRDLMKFDEALRSGKLLGPATWEEACSPYRLNDGQFAQPFDITYCGLGWFIFKDSSQGRIVWGSGANPGTISFFASNLDQKQCFVVLHNVKCNPLHDLDALAILNGKPLAYHAALAFQYAHDLYTLPREQADRNVLQRVADTATYAMRESELDRASLEFRRAGLKAQALATCEMHVRLFPQSGDAYKDHAQTLAEYGQKEKAIEAYKTALHLNPNDVESQEKLKKLSGQ